MVNQQTNDEQTVTACLCRPAGSKLPQKFIAYGALYGAPLKNDGLPAFTRKDYTYAESTTDGISGITGALAGLGEYFTTNQARCDPPPSPNPPFCSKNVAFLEEGSAHYLQCHVMYYAMVLFAALLRHLVNTILWMGCLQF